MFHIGVATQPPPLPEPGQLSDTGIDFIRQCLTIDPAQRPTALELMNHPWILDFREKLRSYEEETAEAAPAAASAAQADTAAFEHASVARQAAILQEQETELIRAASPSMSPLATPEGSTDSSSPGVQESADPLSSPSEGASSSSSSSS